MARANISGTDSQNRYSTEITAGAVMSFETGGPRPQTSTTNASADPERDELTEGEVDVVVGADRRPALHLGVLWQ